jgi:hypothetical protein
MALLSLSQMHSRGRAIQARISATIRPAMVETIAENMLISPDASLAVKTPEP